MNTDSKKLTEILCGLMDDGVPIVDAIGQVANLPGIRREHLIVAVVEAVEVSPTMANEIIIAALSTQ